MRSRSSALITTLVLLASCATPPIKVVPSKPICPGLPNPPGQLLIPIPAPSWLQEPTSTAAPMPTR